MATLEDEMIKEIYARAQELQSQWGLSKDAAWIVAAIMMVIASSLETEVESQ